MKDIIWNSAAKDFVRSLPRDVKREIGTWLLLLQKGEILGFPVSRKVGTIHKSAFELRIKDKAGAVRVIYILALENQILIPHAFRKKSQKTPKKELATATRRLKEML